MASDPGSSIARVWNEELLDAIRNDFARPTVHARNLFHTSIAMWDAWAAYDAVAGAVLYAARFEVEDSEIARREAISFAAYRVLKSRFATSPGTAVTLPSLRSTMLELGYDPDFASLQGNTPAALGNRIGEAVLAFGRADGANEVNDYANLHYTPVNEPLLLGSNATTGNTDAIVLEFDSAGNPKMSRAFGGRSVDATQQAVKGMNGRSYVVGEFWGKTDFDPGPSSAFLESAGSTDVFLLELDEDSEYVWAGRMGGDGFDGGFDTALGLNGSLFVSGTFFGVADVDPGPGVVELTAAGNQDAFLMKLDQRRLSWVQRLGGLRSDVALALALDSDDNVTVTGYYYDELTIARSPTPKAGQEAAVLKLPIVGPSSSFVVQFDRNGDLKWAVAIPGIASDVAVDLSGSVVVSGEFAGTSDFDPGGGEFFLSSAGQRDGFVLKLTADGMFDWALRIGGEAGDAASAVAIDAGGNSYVTGSFEGTVYFDGKDSDPVASNGDGDIWISKFDSQGDAVWTKTVGGPDRDLSRGLAVGVNGPAVTGLFGATTDFDPGRSEFPLQSMGSKDGFVLQLDSSGAFIWASGFGGEDLDAGSGVSIGADGSVLVTGEFADFAEVFPRKAAEPLQTQPAISDPNRWQPLALDFFVDQSGNAIADGYPEFLSAEWGRVTPFALREDALTVRSDSAGQDWWLFHAPDPPPLLTDGAGQEYKDGFAEVVRLSSYLDPADETFIDISPASIGNNSLGQNDGRGRDRNPATGVAYQEHRVKRADYARVLAEFWADGPDSETPPGHWYTILNQVSDHPELVKSIGGRGPIVGDLEWDVKSYLALGGAVHDSAIAAWGAKGYYDYIRPVSAIRYMADKGQSSDPNRGSFHPHGLPLRPGLIEIVSTASSAAGQRHEHLREHVGEIALWTWAGHLPDPKSRASGVAWILGSDWWPYQRPSFVTPPFSGYVSGHSTFSRAAAEVLTMLTGSEYFPGGLGAFQTEKDAFLEFERGPSADVTLQWATYFDAADECGLSRIYGGIHPPADDLAGRHMGAVIGKDAWKLAQNFFDGSSQAEISP